MSKVLAIMQEKAAQYKQLLETVKIYHAPESDGFVMSFKRARQQHNANAFLSWLGGLSGAGNLMESAGDKAFLGKAQVEKIIAYAKKMHNIEISVRPASEIEIPEMDVFRKSRRSTSHSGGARTGAAPVFCSGRKKSGEGPSHIWF